MANDHYVPRFYLNNFSVGGRPGHVFAYKRGIPAPYKTRSIKTLASENDFYRLKSVEQDQIGLINS